MHMGISDLLTSCLTPHLYSFFVFMMEQWQTMKWRSFNAAYNRLPKCWISHKRFSAIGVLCEPGFIHFNVVWWNTIMKVIPSSYTMDKYPCAICITWWTLTANILTNPHIVSSGMTCPTWLHFFFFLPHGLLGTQHFFSLASPDWSL